MGFEYQGKDLNFISKRMETTVQLVCLMQLSTWAYALCTVENLFWFWHFYFLIWAVIPRIEIFVEVSQSGTVKPLFKL